MNFDTLTATVVTRLVSEFAFKTEGDYLRGGKCPACSKKSLWTWKDKPGQIQCNRTNNCSWSATSKELFPDLFEQLNKRHPATPENPNATADAYLALIRGFDPAKLNGWYEQGKYWHPHGDKGTATVRFYLDAEKTIYWERLIEDVTVTTEDGEHETRKMNFKGSFKGIWWQPPGFEIEHDDEIYWCEGILDAIALTLSGKKAVAIMSAGTFPSKSIEAHTGKNVLWVLALDNDKTGREKMRKHAAKLRDMKERVTAAVTSDGSHKLDWNDLWKKNKLDEKDHKHYRYLGRLELAHDRYEKAHAIWQHEKHKTFFVFTFANSTYSYKLDAKEFEEEYVKLKDDPNSDPLKLDFNAFKAVAKIKDIANFALEFLCYLQPVNGEDGKYQCRIHYANGSPSQIILLQGKVFSAGSDFKKQVMQIAPGAQSTASTPEVDFMFKEWFLSAPRIVKTLDFVGYDADTAAYVYTDYAVQNGKLIELNTESFFQLKNCGIKTTFDFKQRLTPKYKPAWFEDYRLAFGIGGLVTLSWWFGSLFAEQIRDAHRSYPFFELVGEGGSGKSDMVDFLWKLLGRDSDVFNPGTSTMVGAIRKFASVGNLPIVCNETDNENVNKPHHQKAFTWDAWKDLYDGEIGRKTGIKSNDNSTYAPRFKASLMIVQNVAVRASEAFLSRIVQLIFDRSHHSNAGKMASDRLNLLDIQDVSGFLLHAAQHETAILKKFEEAFIKHRRQLMDNPKITMARLHENFAKLMAFADCLQLVLPLDKPTLQEVHKKIVALAETRQSALGSDHEVVQEFWARFEYLNSAENIDPMQFDARRHDHLMNHAAEPERYIAVNLPHFEEASRSRGQPVSEQTVALWKQHLPQGRRYKYVGYHAMHSRIQQRTLRCYIFMYEKPPPCKSCGSTIEDFSFEPKESKDFCKPCRAKAQKKR